MTAPKKRTRRQAEPGLRPEPIVMLSPYERRALVNHQHLYLRGALREMESLWLSKAPDTTKQAAYLVKGLRPEERCLVHRALCIKLSLRNLPGGTKEAREDYCLWAAERAGLFTRIRFSLCCGGYSRVSIWSNIVRKENHRA